MGRAGPDAIGYYWRKRHRRRQQKVIGDDGAAWYLMTYCVKFSGILTMLHTFAMEKQRYYERFGVFSWNLWGINLQIPWIAKKKNRATTLHAQMCVILRLCRQKGWLLVHTLLRGTFQSGYSLTSPKKLIKSEAQTQLINLILKTYHQ